MAAQATSSAVSPPAPKKRMRDGLLILLALIVLSSLAYYRYIDSKQSFINSNYFRVLAESARTFNEKLSQLIRLHDNNQTLAAIRAVFPTYKKLNSPPSCPTDQQKAWQLNYDGHRFNILLDCKSANSSVSDTKALSTLKTSALAGSVDNNDIWPSPSDGFSMLLVVTDTNEVIGHSGNNLLVEINNTTELARQLNAKLQANWAELAAGKQTSQDSPDQFSGVSQYLDVTLNDQDFRLYIYPLLLEKNIHLAQQNRKLQSLYLIGVLPKTQLQARDNQRWNLSLLSLVLVALMFSWVMLRLFLLSSHQPVGSIFYRSTMACSYLLFVMVMALLIAFMERHNAEAQKRQLADQLASNMVTQSQQELYRLFRYLQGFKVFYRSIMTIPISGNEFDYINQITALPNPPFTIGMVSTSAGNSLIGQLNNGEKANPLKAIEVDPQQRINLYPPQFQPVSTQTTDYSVWARDLYTLPGNVQDIVVIDTDGNTILPVSYFIENNRPPAHFNLAHREYFKRVRDQMGWNGVFCPTMPSTPNCISEPNFFIQRLRNIDSGVKGTPCRCHCFPPPLRSPGLRPGMFSPPILICSR